MGFAQGKLENNETFAKCALREVEEECGIKDLVIEHKLVSYHHHIFYAW